MATHSLPTKRDFQSTALARAFETWMLGHLERHFPVDLQLLGEAQARLLIQHGVARAAVHGFTQGHEVCCYINLMLALGSGFDRDPQLASVARMPGRAPSEDRTTGMKLLYGAALEYLRQVSGTRGQFYLKALVRARSLSFSRLAASWGSAGEGMGLLLGELYPEKFRAMKENLDPLLWMARASARQYGLGGPAPLALQTVLMFMAGAHFDRDPAFPWAAGILKDTSSGTPLDRARLLLGRALEHLDRAMELVRARKGV
jgi:hypothetical protein